MTDAPRQWWRSARKKIGLPASTDVGYLAEVIGSLRDQAEGQIGPLKIRSAVIAIPNIPAIYQEDLTDAFEYLDLEYVDVHHNWRLPFLVETSVAYAGYGMGLGSNFTDKDHWCKERLAMNETQIFSVCYTKDALTTAFSMIKSAYSLWEPMYRRNVSLELGSRFQGEDEYWMNVEEELYALTNAFPGLPKPKKLLVLGDASGNDRFAEMIRNLAEYYGPEAKIFSEDSVFAAAKGAAQFHRRGPDPCGLWDPIKPPSSGMQQVLSGSIEF